MPTVNDKFLRDELQVAKDQIEALGKTGKVSQEVNAVFRVLIPLLTLLLSVLLEKSTCKNSSNPSTPPSQVVADETAQRANPGRRAAKANDWTDPNLQKATTEETITVEACDNCGTDLSNVDPIDRDRQILYDIVFQVIEHRVEVKQFPDGQARSKAAFPATMPGRWSMAPACRPSSSISGGP